jgi:hypothetical protein
MEGELVMITKIVVLLKNCVTSKNVSVTAVLLGSVFLVTYHWGLFANVLAQEIKGKEPIAIASIRGSPYQRRCTRRSRKSGIPIPFRLRA